MVPIEKVVTLYLTEAGGSPFEDWFDRLRDLRAQQKILARVARARAVNPGDWKSVGIGVRELRIDYGPGYRVYFGQDGERMVILLLGGDKRTQDRDILRAQAYWQDYHERKKIKNF